MQYHALVEEVARRAGLGSAREAGQALEAVLGVLAGQLDEPGRTRLADSLPPSLAEPVRSAMPAPELDDQAFIRQVARREHSAPEEARMHTQAVLSVLRQHLSESDQPGEPGDLEEQAGRQDPDLTEPPHTSTQDVGVTEPPPRDWIIQPAPTTRQLDAAEVERWSERLTGWTGDPSRLVRTATVAPERVRPVLDQVAQIGTWMQHRPVVRVTENTLTFEVFTHSVGAVTELDIELAAQIDLIIDEAGYPS